MHQTTPEAAAQLQKIMKAGKASHVIMQIITAFAGIGLSLALIGIIFAGSLRLELGDGDFDLRGLEAPGTEPRELQIVRPRGSFFGAAEDGQTPAEARVALSTGMRVGLVTMALVNAATVLYLLGSIAALFGHYERGEIFTRAVVSSIRRVGIALIAFPAMGILNSAMGSLLAVNLAPQLDYVDVEIKFDMLFAALVVLMISWIMDMGRSLQEDSELVI